MKGCTCSATILFMGLGQSHWGDNWFLLKSKMCQKDISWTVTRDRSGLWIQAAGTKFWPLPPVCLSRNQDSLEQAKFFQVWVNLCPLQPQLSMVCGTTTTRCAILLSWLICLEVWCVVHPEMLFCSPQSYRFVIYVTLAFLSAWSSLAIPC